MYQRRYLHEKILHPKIPENGFDHGSFPGRHDTLRMDAEHPVQPFHPGLRPLDCIPTIGLFGRQNDLRILTPRRILSDLPFRPYPTHPRRCHQHRCLSRRGGTGFSENNIFIPALIIAITTFLLSLSGVCCGFHFGKIKNLNVEFVGGLILIFIGLKILIEHTLGY